MVKKHLLITYHSQGGNTYKLAMACMTGVKKEADIEMRFRKAVDSDLEDVKWADGIVICTPEYFGNMCGAIKDFFDRTYYPARELAINKPYVLFICCENDGSGAQRNVETIATGYILRKALDTIIVKEKDLENQISFVEEQAQTFAAGLAMDIF